jgi:hypothetical protein
VEDWTHLSLMPGAHPPYACNIAIDRSRPFLSSAPATPISSILVIAHAPFRAPFLPFVKRCRSTSQYGVDEKVARRVEMKGRHGFDSLQSLSPITPPDKRWPYLKRVAEIGPLGRHWSRPATVKILCHWTFDIKVVPPCVDPNGQ